MQPIKENIIAEIQGCEDNDLLDFIWRLLIYSK